MVGNVISTSSGEIPTKIPTKTNVFSQEAISSGRLLPSVLARLGGGRDSDDGGGGGVSGVRPREQRQCDGGPGIHPLDLTRSAPGPGASRLLAPRSVISFHI